MRISDDYRKKDFVLNHADDVELLPYELQDDYTETRDHFYTFSTPRPEQSGWYVAYINFKCESIES